MAAQREGITPPLRVLEEALGLGLTTAGDVEDAVAAEGTYYLEQVTITEASEDDDFEYEEIPDDNFSIPEGEEDLTKAMQMFQEQVTDSQILEQKTVLPSKREVPEVIEDFLCNFLIKMGMTRTLDCFQSEWYELIQKGVTEVSGAGNVPDVYSQNMLLENENKNLKKDLKHYKQAADKAREDLLKTQKERDFHRMHHKRIVQEKNKLINDLKGLKLHYASYEPTIRVLLEKHQTLLKQKMMTSLERDKAAKKVCLLRRCRINYTPTAMSKSYNQGSGPGTKFKLMEPGNSYQASKIRVVSDSEKNCEAEDPTQKGLLREVREQTKYKTRMKDNTKASSRNREEAHELSARSTLCPTRCLHQQFRGSSQTWNKTTPLQDTTGSRQQSARTLRERLPTYSRSPMGDSEQHMSLSSVSSLPSSTSKASTHVLFTVEKESRPARSSCAAEI
ncbi:sperm-associated antigen 16 protein isoform X5 [Phyllostomus discolor]|uniref:Sperm-associated antigen 16 protein isoform X5 n=1 Tax=Phyllostomus discolor TaxID=89673 RepID=A0A7E6DI77_9CHIR|nr:sperm-associated antigen 16 protein isoform X5 [Phyllostomus discolor]